MKVVYIHGYGGSSSGDTAKGLKTPAERIFGDGAYVALDYPQTTALESYNSLLGQLQEIVDTGDDVTLIASSLGGFWGLYFSRYFQIPLVSINPSLQPWKSLKKYGCKNVNDYRVFGLEVIRDGVQRVTIFGSDDDVVPSYYSRKCYEGKALIIDLPMGHRLDPRYYDLVAEQVKNMDDVVAFGLGG